MILYFVWHISTTCNIYFWTFRLFVFSLDLHSRCEFGFVYQTCEQKEVFGHKWWNLWNWYSWECILTKIIKGKWIFIMLFLLTPTWRIYSWVVYVVWAPYSDYCMVCFFRKVFFKSDTTVALRTSVSLILWKTCIFHQSLWWVFLLFDVALCNFSGCFGGISEHGTNVNWGFWIEIWTWSNKTYMYCVTLSPGSVIWWRS